MCVFSGNTVCVFSHVAQTSLRYPSLSLPLSTALRNGRWLAVKALLSMGSFHAKLTLPLNYCTSAVFFNYCQSKACMRIQGCYEHVIREGNVAYFWRV